MQGKKLYRYRRFSHYLKEGLHEEAQAWLTLARESWAWLVLLLFGLASLLYLARPWPPGKVYMAVGQPGSSYEMMGERFRDHFRHHRIKLDLVNTSGSIESLKELADPDNKVNAAFLMGGSSRRGDFPNLVSLGSVQYSPLWIFYRGKEISTEDPMQYFSDKLIAIGTPGTGTQSLLKKLIELRGFEFRMHSNFLELPHAQAEADLIASKIDAMCLVESFDSPLVQNLLRHKDIHILDFKLVAAYAKKLPFLDMVVIPRGSLDLRRIYPDHDIHLPATTMTLLVEKDLHPAIQQLFLMAAEQASQDRNHFFARPDFFPTYIDHSIPLSEIAKLYYDKGPPTLAHHLPFWLASFFDRVWLATITLLALIIPFLKLVPTYRRFHSGLAINGAYEALKEIDTVMLQARDAESLDEVFSDLDELEDEIGRTWISSDNLDSYYALRKALDHVRQQAHLKYPGKMEPSS